MDPQHANQGQPYLFFSAILSYLPVTFLIDVSFYFFFILFLLGFPLPFFCFLDLNQFSLLHWCINRYPLHMTNHLNQLLFIFSSIGSTLYLSEFSYFKSCLSLYFLLFILTFSFWYTHFMNILLLCFLIAQHSIPRSIAGLIVKKFNLYKVQATAG